MKVLVLGGTGEARSLAAALACRPRTEFVSSLAGRVRDPVLPAGLVRLGGFGGTAGLLAYLRAEHIDAVVDATHPFAATITTHAERACAVADVPLVLLRRPGWTPSAADDWLRVASILDAPNVIDALVPTDSCVFLTTGRRDLATFAGDVRRRYLVRTVDPPQEPFPPRTEFLLARGPYTLAGERELMRVHRVRLLVTKDSGGTMTSAKLEAARRLAIRVLIVSRPPVPAGARQVEDVAGALRWLDTVGGSAGRG
jgi:precorrin-6A/cobalt-precorrin-6A reductase